MILREWLISKLTREQLDAFVAAHATNAHTLDIGCCDSPYSKYFPNRVGFDIESGKGVDVVGDAHTLPFKDSEFENILCTEVLEHLHTPERAIAEMKRVLKPNGTLLLSTRFVFPIHDAPGDYFRYTKYGLRHLFRDWEIVEMREEVSTMKTIGVLLQRVVFQSDLRGGIFSKTLLLLGARLVGSFQFLIRKEYGMKSKRGIHKEHSVMTSGYYLVARKRDSAKP
jgi:SAM-dependent methyltransferase